MSRVATPVADRIKALVKIDEAGCWIWQGHVSRGYGSMTIGSRTDGSRRQAQAHRVAYEAFVAPISEGMTLDHLCRIRTCVNPDHLEPVTNQENHRRRPRKIRCPQGHPLSVANVYVNKAGGRLCRECGRVMRRRSDRKRSERLRALEAG